MSTKASRSLRVVQHAEEIPLNDTTLLHLPLVCTKCGKTSNSTDVVEIVTKSGEYRYIRWRHLDNRKRSGYASHYRRIQAPLSQTLNESQ